jgi:hypothetical protein
MGEACGDFCSKECSEEYLSKCDPNTLELVSAVNPDMRPVALKDIRTLERAIAGSNSKAIVPSASEILDNSKVAITDEARASIASLLNYERK